MDYTYSYLALGDSYTIGEGVPVSESYPYQAVQVLRKQEKLFYAPEIIAKTGWTTGELLEQIRNTELHPSYDFVSLLIGVNNQYRGQPAEEYRKDLDELLKISLEKAGHLNDRVILLSIPDWGLSPFGRDQDRQAVTKDISRFNAINRALSIIYQVHYVDITTGSPEVESDKTYFASDGLHPSPKAYKRWAAMLAETMLKAMK